MEGREDVPTPGIAFVTPAAGTAGVTWGLMRTYTVRVSSPVVMPILLQLLDAADRSGVLGALLLGAHVLTAWLVSCLARAAQLHDQRSPRIIGVVYLLSPWNVAACAALSSAGVSHLLTAVALLAAHTCGALSSSRVFRMLPAAASRHRRAGCRSTSTAPSPRSRTPRSATITPGTLIRMLSATIGAVCDLGR